METITIKMSSPLGITAPICIQEIARKNLPSYHAEYSTDLVGKGSNGELIRVNSIGRFVFGVPGVAPHVRIAAMGNNVVFYFNPALDTLIKNFINELKNYIELTNSKTE